MASSPGPGPASPATPDSMPRRIAMNRSFTVPAKITTPTKPANLPPEIGSAEGIETLYVHPNASIIKFTTPSGSSSPGRPQSSSSTLAWTYPTERTMAAGSLEIYRVPGSVSFLHSGTLLHAIMPRSNCWCVDGISTFVLRVLPDTYYRIELPGKTPEDLEEVEKFKVTLQKVLFYERTPCPFARTFTVDLPEEPEVRKKRRKSAGPAKKWKLDRVWRPDGWIEPESRGSEDSSSGSGSSAGSEDESEAQEDGGGSGERTPVEAESLQMKPPMKMSQRAMAMAALRSVSAPHAPTLERPSPSRLRTRVNLDGTVEVSESTDSASTVRETSRLRTFQAIPTDMPPSPPDSSAGLEYMEDNTQSNTAEDPKAENEPLVANQDPVESTVLPATSTDHATVVDAPRFEPTDVQFTDTADEPTLPPTRVTGDESLQDLSLRVFPGEQHRGDNDDFRPTPPVEWTTDRDTPLPNDPESQQPGEESDTVRPSTPVHHTSVGNATLPTVQATIEQESRTISSDATDNHQPIEESDEDRPRTPTNQTSAEDPYAAIQARILARRSIGGTTAFYPLHKSPTRQSTSSTSSTATITSNKSAISRCSRPSKNQQDYASAMVQKAYSVFLGPPAHLVAIMLRIAARFANGAFGVNSMLYVETPVDAAHDVPGTYHIQGGAVSDPESDSDVDDFGVPLRSPVRRATRSESTEGLRERRAWDVD